MKKMLYYLIVFIFIGVINIHAQRQITVHLGLGCEIGTTILSPQTINEGEVLTFTAENLVLPASYSSVQGLANMLIGGEFYFENGCFPENPTIYFILSGVQCSTGFYNNNLMFNANFSVFINNTHQPSPYWFGGSSAAGPSAVLKIPNTLALADFVAASGINPSAIIDFVYKNEDGSFDSSGISTELPNAAPGTPNTFYTVKMRHFSYVVGGDKNTLTDVTGEVIAYKDYQLHQNYPNPFNPTTTITFALPAKAEVELKVYNILGVEVATLLKGVKNEGLHSVDFDGTGLSSGMYIYELKTNKFSQSRKMILLK
jgi:hypothetical protein